MISIRTYQQPAHRHFSNVAHVSLGAWLNEVARTQAADAPHTPTAANADAATTGTTLATVAPRVSVEEVGDTYEVRAELPGIAREHIKVAVDGKRLSIHTTIEGVAKNLDAAATTAKLIYSNRVPANYASSFTLPQAVNAEAVNASLENGVLTLRLPKLAVPPVHHITIA